MHKRPKQPVEGLFCNYAHRTCMHNRIDGYEFCMKHILEDKMAPFKQCGFISNKNGKKCPNAAPKSDRKDGHCPEHAKKAAILRQRASRKRQPDETAEILLEELDHCKTSTFRNGAGGTSETRKMKGYTDSTATKVLEYATSSDSEDEPPLVDQAWRGDGDSDAESIDSDQEDLLKHAGIYTAEEVALIMRDKLIRLQSLYIDQFKRLQHIMREKRRKYLHTYKQERDTLGPIKSYKRKVETRDKYTKLKALKRYHKRYGKEALLHRQSKERRIQASEGVNYRPPIYPKCMHIESNQKCSQRALPLSKYCSQHILNDPHQVLYRTCQFAEGECSKPVASIDDDILCPIHTQLTDTEAKINLKNEDKDDDLDVDKGIFSKETMDLLIPHLESFPQDFLSQPFLSQNPELPDTIFSTDTTEQASTSSKSNDPTKLLSKYIDDQVIPPLSSTNYKRSKVNNKPPASSYQSSAYNTIADDHKYGQTPLDQMPVVPDLDSIRPAPGPKPGPILLQHLQGNIDLSSMRSKQYYPSSSVSSKKPGSTDQTSDSSSSVINISNSNSLLEQTTLSTSLSLSSNQNSNSNSSTSQNSVSQTVTSSSTNQNSISHYLHPPSHSAQTGTSSSSQNTVSQIIQSFNNKNTTTTASHGQVTSSNTSSQNTASVSNSQTMSSGELTTSSSNQNENGTTPSSIRIINHSSTGTDTSNEMETENT